MLFGLANAPAWASAISLKLYVIICKAGVMRCSAYIDDVICMGDTFEECQRSLDMFLRICSELGVAIRASKIKMTSTNINYWGIRIQKELSMLSIDPDMCTRG